MHSISHAVWRALLIRCMCAVLSAACARVVLLPGGAYDLEGLAEHLHRRGLYKDLLDSVMTLDGRVRTHQHTQQQLDCAQGHLQRQHRRPCS